MFKIDKRKVAKFQKIGKVVIAVFEKEVVEDMDREFFIRDTKVFDEKDCRIGFGRTIKTFDYLEGKMTVDHYAIQVIR